jgi:hypothetical protein
LSVFVFLSLAPAWVLSGSATAGSVCWPPAVAAEVIDPFREPACRWCPGNRGVEYGTAPGDAARAVATGTVVFSGTVAGTGYLVVRLGDGRRVTYGNLSERRFGEGDAVAAGVVVGRTAGAFHLGLREGERYVDPAPFIGRWVGVVRLVPIDGDQPAPAPPPRLVCDAVGGARSPIATGATGVDVVGITGSTR